MSAWFLEFSRDAEEDLARLDRKVRKQIVEKLDWFIANFDSLFPIPLTGKFREFCKLRAGDWRVFYSIKWTERIIRIEYIDNRDKAYKRRRGL